MWAHASAFHAPARSPLLASDQSKRTTGPFWARLLVRFPSFFLFLSIVFFAKHAFLIFIHLTIRLFSFHPRAAFIAVPVRKPELEQKVVGGGCSGKDLVSPPHRPSVLMANRCVWVSPCGRGPGSFKGEPDRASPFLHEGTEKTSCAKSGD